MGAIYYKNKKYGAMPASAANLPYDAGSQDSTKDKIDANAAAITALDTNKADKSELPTWIKQAVGTSIQIQVPATFFYYYADQWQAFVPFPFIAKNTNYSINLDEIIAENVGAITNKCSVISKTSAFFQIQTTRTMSNLPNTYSTCVARCKFTITFA